METPIQLIKMPEDSMRHILQRCDFVSIQCLRKTCHTFRDFVDETKPSPQLNGIKISGRRDKLSLVFFEKNNKDDLYPNGPKIQLDYEGSRNGNVKITWHRSDENREKTIGNDKAFDVLSRDLGTALDQKTSEWNRMTLQCHYDVVEMLTKKFLSLTPPLKVHAIRIDSRGFQGAVVELLRTLCPESLTKLRIGTNYAHWNISKRMVQLEQWKKVKELDLAEINVSMDVEDYAHFEKAKIRLSHVEVDDLLGIKDVFLQTPSLTKRFEMKLDLINYPNRDKLKEVFGEYYLSEDNRAYWYWKRPDNNIVCMYFSCIFIFTIVSKDAVPRDAPIL